MSYKIAVSKAHHIGKGGFVMRLTGGVPPQPKFYRCAVQEGDLVRLPSEVCQVLQVRTRHRVDFRILEDRVELFHAWPCCQLCGGSEKLRQIRRSFLCNACLEAIRAADLSLPPLPDDAGLRKR